VVLVAATSSTTSVNSWSTGTGPAQRPTFLRIYAPPGSGYAGPQDEQSVLPDTYEPMMEYPGTMRPGKTPENQPFQDLPLGDDDPDPVPWPHFQQIEWHHQWAPPHDHPIPMELFIEQQGRWATPEMEAAMRAGARRNVREAREQQEADRAGNLIITDDDDDDDDPRDGMDIEDEPIALGDGIFGQLGSDADRAATAIATSPQKEEELEDEEEDDGLLDDFLLDLGLDSELELPDTPKSKTAAKLGPTVRVNVASSLVDDDDDENDTTNEIAAAITVEDDFDLGLDDEDDPDLSEDGTVALESSDSFDSDTIDGEDVFGEGGFDFDESDYGGDFDGGDSW
jgi:hypothetical protein